MAAIRTDPQCRGRLYRRIAAACLAATLTPLLADAGPITTGVILHESGASDNYTLFSPNLTTTTYLIKKNGTIVNQWESEHNPGLHAYLLEDGSLIRAADAENNSVINAAGGGGLIERFDWHGNKVWEYDYNHDANFDNAVLQHHDIEVMPNGNILMIAWETMSAAEAEQAGRDDTLPGGGAPLYPEHIIEVQPDLESGSGGSIVWEWHVTDHFVQDHDPTKDNYEGPTGVADHPELIDINYVSDQANGGGAPNDWIHANGIDYNAELDQIVLSVREYSEFWVIDHSTTTEEAASDSGGNAGMGGNLLYRWGNPQTYDAGNESDRMLFFQHDAKWIPDGYPGEGNITVFDNGWGGPNLSSSYEITPPLVGLNYTLTPGDPYGPTGPVWSYTAPPVDFSMIISGTQRLANGNTLLTFGPDGAFVEVTPAGEVVWRYVNPYIPGGMLGPMDLPTPIGFVDLNNNFVFRATDYARDFLLPGVPEPGSLGLAVFGACGLLAARRRRKQS